MTGTPQLRLAIVGCGAISRMHLNAVEASGGAVRVTAAVDTAIERAEAVAAETGAMPFASLDAALADGDFDAVAILLPPALHERAACAALAAGKHVLLEKPMALELAACDRILATARAAGRVLMVAENAQYWPEVVIAKRLIDEGAIGEVITARASSFATLMIAASFYEGASPWRFQKSAAGGGVALDIGSHWIRPLRMFMGEIEEVVAILDRPLAQMEGESLARALLRFRSGRSASFEVMLVDGMLGMDTFFRVTGTRGEIVIDAEMGGRVVLFNETHFGQAIDEPCGYMESYAPQLGDFARACLDGTPLAAGPEAAIGELRAALAMYRSAETKRWERVWD
ncbi:MAG: Gfo/Idh/MocA family oxidoreductase [bacterium]